MAASASNLHARIDSFPDLPDRLVARVSLEGAVTKRSPLLQFIDKFSTNRRPGQSRPLESQHLAVLEELAEQGGVRLEVAREKTQLGEPGSIVGRTDRLLFLNAALHKEMMSEIRWSKRSAWETKDGVDVEHLNLLKADETVLRLLSRGMPPISCESRRRARLWTLRQGSLLRALLLLEF